MLWRHTSIETVIGFVVGLALCVALAGCGGSTAQAHSTSGGVPAGPALKLTIEDFTYSPNPLKVAPGTVIAVTNKDDTAHTVTAYDGAFSTGNIGPTATITFVAPSIPATYRFRCTIHPKMVATLVVH